MKKIIMMLRHHWKEDFNAKAYLSLSVFLIIALSFNYYFDFEDAYVDRVSPIWSVPVKFLWFAFFYFPACFIIIPFYNKKNILRWGEFWIASIFIIYLMALDSAFPIYEWVIKNNLHSHIHLYLSKVSRNLLNIPFIFLPVLAFCFVDQEKNGFYGLTIRFNPKPYIGLLLIMLPLLFSASLFENFSKFYPMYKGSLADEYWNVPEGILIAVYEFFYGWNFFSVEFMFRGFLVIGMIKYLGRQAILPMVVLYCAYHFGKPAGEAISSIFGGYILGVIAFETKSIFGGVLLHIGVAWAMELLGFIF